jgi:DNA-binding XRE family transcriptional regulator
MTENVLYAIIGVSFKIGNQLMQASVMLVRKTVFAEAPNLGQRIKDAKDRSGKSIEKVCREVGISRQTWYNIENEFLKSGIDYEMLQKIEECLNFDSGVKL